MISLIHPSRARAEKAFITAWDWIDRAGVTVEYIISLDTDDPQRDQYAEKFLTKKKVITDNKSLVDATNNAARYSTGDILLYLSDDFKCPDNWGSLILKEFDTDQPRMLKVDDCLQKFDVGVLTIPIMNRQLYNLLGYFFNPLYKSMHVDVDLFETTKRFIKYCPHLKFPHDHHSLGKCENDDTYRRSEANWDQGLQVIKQRRRQGFPI